MKFPSPFAALIFTVWVAAPSISSGQPVPAPAVTNAIGPRMTFETNNYNFGRVNTGTQVHHTYIVTNTGDQTLVISSVAPGCHCTSAGVVLPLKIEPGQTGEIPVKFDSGGLRGDVTRTITVTSNGKPLPVQTLYLHGKVWQEIQVIPANAYMTVSPDMDTPASGSVRIVSEGEAPLSILEATSDNRAFKAEFTAARPGKEFTLTVTAQPPFKAGNIVGHIIVKTSSTNMPVLNILAIANVQQAVSVAPMQIVLPPSVPGWTTNLVTISANSRKSLALSDLQVCCDNLIKAELKEIIPGRVFHLLVAVPPGFTLAGNQRAQVSVKSNNPERPVIIVLITQFQARPGLAPARPRVISQGLPPSPVVAHP